MIKNVIKTELQTLKIDFIENYFHEIFFDFYIPERKVGFSVYNPYNNLSLGTSSRKQSYIKAKKCNLKGITNYFIWSTWEPEKIKDIIRSKLSKSLVIYARNCDFVKLSNKESKEFLIDNHLHGYIPASVVFALKHQNAVIQVLSFKKKDCNVFECSRLCTKQGVTVVGGASKLFSNALKILKKPDDKITIYSYAYRDLSPEYKNCVYSKLGFTFEGATQPSLYFLITKETTFPNGKTLQKGVYSRQKFQSHKLKKFLGISQEQLTEYNIYKIYDSGNLKFKIQI